MLNHELSTGCATPQAASLGCRAIPFSGELSSAAVAFQPSAIAFAVGRGAVARDHAPIKMGG
jgi:hypothetical protein